MPKLIPHNWAVPDRFRQRLGAQAGRQRAMIHEGHLLLVLHQLPKAGDPTRRPALFWRAPDGQWKASEGKSTIASLQAHAETFQAAALALEDRVERAGRAAEYFEILREISPILRTSRGLHKALQEARDGIAADRDLITIRDIAYETERTAELVHTDAQTGLEFTVAKRAEEQAELSDHILAANHRLNLIAALFFPATAVGSILGMNLLHGFESWQAPWTFWAVAAVALLIGLMLRSALNKKRSEA
jgi:hypothetical protein